MVDVLPEEEVHGQELGRLNGATGGKEHGACEGATVARGGTKEVDRRSQEKCKPAAVLTLKSCVSPRELRRTVEVYMLDRKRLAQLVEISGTNCFIS